MQAVELKPRELGRLGLAYADVAEPGFSRRRCGKGFVYLTPKGARIGAAKTVERLRSLAAPPAWEDVWYCTKDNGHIQATGKDARARKQYIYDPSWREWRDAQKFERMGAFGRALPKARKAALAALRSKDSEKRACATVFRLLDRGALRVGNDYYADENGAYGATTLKKRHISVNGSTVALAFRAKGGQSQHIEIADRALARAVREFEGLPGQRLFQISDEEGVRPLTSDAVNQWIKEVMGDEFSAKDFRTFRATAIAAETLAALDAPETVKAKHEGLKAAACAAAEALGNTPAMCKKSYIAPGLGELWAEGKLAPLVARASASKLKLALPERIAVFLGES